MKFEQVTIIIGTTDEDKSLRLTVDTIMETCDAADISRILMVRPKNASEGCLSAIKAMEEKYKGIAFGLEQTRPFIGGAIRDGFDAATGSHIMLLPGDMAISLDCVPQMIKMVKEKPDVIAKTSRWLEKDSFYGYNPARKLINRLSQVFLRILYGVKLTDFTSPVQTAPAEVYRKADWQELNFPFMVEMVLLPLRMGVEFSEFPVRCYSRQEGKSKNSVGQTALYLKTALRIRFTKRNKLIRVTEE